MFARWKCILDPQVSVVAIPTVTSIVRSVIPIVWVGRVMLCLVVPATRSATGVIILACRGGTSDPNTLFVGLIRVVPRNAWIGVVTWYAIWVTAPFLVVPFVQFPSDIGVLHESLKPVCRCVDGRRWIVGVW